MIHALLHFVQAQAWGALLVLGFIGWGFFLLRLPASQPTSAGLAATVGICAAVFIGGLLNLCHLITGWLLIAFTLVGCVFTLIYALSSKDSILRSETAPLLSAWTGKSAWGKIALLAFIILLLFHLAAMPRIPFYQPTDDEQFYLAEPVKMMAMHYVPEDPFSERRIQGTVGGHFFLQALILSALPLQNIQMADKYLGYVLTVLIALALARQFGLPPLDTTFFCFLSLGIASMDDNLTFAVLPSALFLALVLVATHPNLRTTRPAVQAFLVGLIAGTICSLKTTYLPHAVFFCLALYLLWGFRHGWKLALTGWVFSLLGALVVLVPWMIAMRVTSGTWLYPVLGAGYDHTAYHSFPSGSTLDLPKLIKGAALYGLPLAAILFTQFFFLRRDDRSTVLLALTAASLAGILASDVATGGDSIRRYGFPVVKPVLLLLFLQLCAETHARPLWKPARFLQALTAAAIIATTLLLEFTPYVAHDYAAMWQGIIVSAKDSPLAPADVRDEYAQISSALPKQGTILATLQHPYLLDGLDHRVLLADWPGCAGLPPGWPVHGDGEALADYLLQHSIRYLAYSYSDNVQLTRCLGESDFSGWGNWRKDQYLGYLIANKQYLELRRSRQALYDDGKIFIIDLATRSAPPS